ncbi:kinase-like protein [Rhizopus microsporus var. microsporus]|uniref:Kinase-like protein n=1 Tax=Rhizopus microsporus var. microsporus TaxID=86635 RepID=A0A1X0R5S1_RHIZD|nr:kinase-like protein [Rhizopus microsporus var. microsporus]
MGNKISTVTAIAGIDSYVSELNDINYQKSIGNARFMKTILGRHERDGYVVVKIFVKPELGMSLKKRVKKLKEEYKTLSDVHNAFSFQRILETDRAAYLVRQYLYSNLYDRISTRPFLTTIEKKWIAYQLIRGVADFHSRKVYHGDIKTENVLVTSWNWAFIVDFASFKPTYLPEDNPADFSFFFDTSSRRTCYIAPERFYKAGTEIDQRIVN